MQCPTSCAMIEVSVFVFQVSRYARLTRTELYGLPPEGKPAEARYEEPEGAAEITIFPPELTLEKVTRSALALYLAIAASVEET